MGVLSVIKSPCGNFTGTLFCIAAKLSLIIHFKREFYKVLTIVLKYVTLYLQLIFLSRKPWLILITFRN